LNAGMTMMTRGRRAAVGGVGAACASEANDMGDSLPGAISFLKAPQTTRL